MISDKNYNPREDGALLWNTNLMSDEKEFNAALFALYKLQSERPKSIVVELNMYRKHVPKLLEMYFLKADLLNASIKENERFHSDCEDKKHKKWTEEEDKLLIDLVCDSEQSPMEIAIALGRSVSSIKTRVSTLVGRKRLSQKVVGKFVGKIGDEDAETTINGVVYKGA